MASRPASHAAAAGVSLAFNCVLKPLVSKTVPPSPKVTGRETAVGCTCRRLQQGQLYALIHLKAMNPPQGNITNHFHENQYIFLKRKKSCRAGWRHLARRRLTGQLASHHRLGGARGRGALMEPPRARGSGLEEGAGEPQGPGPSGRGRKASPEARLWAWSLPCGTESVPPGPSLGAACRAAAAAGARCAPSGCSLSMPRWSRSVPQAQGRS